MCGHVHSHSKAHIYRLNLHQDLTSSAFTLKVGKKRTTFKFVCVSSRSLRRAKRSKSQLVLAAEEGKRLGAMMNLLWLAADVACCAEDGFAMVGVGLT